MPFPTSNLSSENVLRDVHDQVTQSLRTTASATIVVPGGLDVAIDHTEDSIRLGNGTNFITSTSATGKVALDVNLINTSDIGDIRPLNVLIDSISAPNVESRLDSLLTELQLKADATEAQNIRNLTSVSDSVSVPELSNTNTILTDIETALSNPLTTTNPTVEGKLDNLLAELELKANINEAQNIRDLSSLTDSVSVPELSTTNALLTDIETALYAPLEVDLDAFTSTPDSVQLVGSNDGLSTGDKFGIVYNIRKAILDSEDRESDIAYADFGTKNQRVTSITYTSPTFPGRSATKQLTYTLVGNRYRRDSIDWTIT